MKITKAEAGKFVVRLSIVDQIDLGLYIEALPEMTKTYVFRDLTKLVEKARESCLTYEVSVDQVKSWEIQGLTYEQVHLLHNPDDSGEMLEAFSDAKFDASEDLQFLYRRLYKLNLFIYNALTT